jgi:RNase P protein component
MTLTLVRVAATLIGACLAVVLVRVAATLIGVPLAAGLLALTKLALWVVRGKVERAINRWRWRRWLRSETGH